MITGLKVYLARGLYKLSFLLKSLSNRLMAEPVKLLENLYQKELADEDLSAVVFALKDIPTKFVTFSEGLASRDYCTRHDAAAKVVSFYVDEKGQPVLEDVIKAARVLLEDSQATEGDVSYLVGSWKDQASSVTQEQREKAEELEKEIYRRVFKSQIN